MTFLLTTYIHAYHYLHANVSGPENNYKILTGRNVSIFIARDMFALTCFCKKFKFTPKEVTAFGELTYTIYFTMYASILPDRTSTTVILLVQATVAIRPKILVKKIQIDRNTNRTIGHTVNRILQK